MTKAATNATKDLSALEHSFSFEAGPAPLFQRNKKALFSAAATELGRGLLDGLCSKEASLTERMLTAVTIATGTKIANSAFHTRVSVGSGVMLSAVMADLVEYITKSGKVAILDSIREEVKSKLPKLEAVTAEINAEIRRRVEEETKVIAATKKEACHHVAGDVEPAPSAPVASTKRMPYTGKPSDPTPLTENELLGLSNKSKVYCPVCDSRTKRSNFVKAGGSGSKQNAKVLYFDCRGVNVDVPILSKEVNTEAVHGVCMCGNCRAKLNKAVDQYLNGSNKPKKEASYTAVNDVEEQRKFVAEIDSQIAAAEAAIAIMGNNAPDDLKSDLEKLRADRIEAQGTLDNMEAAAATKKEADSTKKDDVPFSTNDDVAGLESTIATLKKLGIDSSEAEAKLAAIKVTDNSAAIAKLDAEIEEKNGELANVRASIEGLKKASVPTASVEEVAGRLTKEIADLTARRNELVG